MHCFWLNTALKSTRLARLVGASHVMRENLKQDTNDRLDRNRNETRRVLTGATECARSRCEGHKGAAIEYSAPHTILGGQGALTRANSPFILQCSESCKETSNVDPKALRSLVLILNTRWSVEISTHPQTGACTAAFSAQGSRPRPAFAGAEDCGDECLTRDFLPAWHGFQGA